MQGQQNGGPGSLFLQVSREGSSSEGSKRSSSNRSKLPEIVQGGNNPSAQYSRAIPLAGGVPIYEVMKKLEIEKLLSREERITLVEILRDERYRERFLNEIHQLEIGTRQQTNIKRLRMLIKRYQHANRRDSESGGVGGANERQGTQEMMMMSREQTTPITDTKQTLIQVVGPSPKYSEFANSGVLVKCRERLNDFISQYGIEKARETQFAVILGSGSCNPVTRMHIRRFFIAKQCIESSSQNMFVLGSLISPSHPDLVRQRYRTFPREIIPAPHRLAISQLSVKDSIWVNVDPWEITRRRVMDYLSILEHLSVMIQLEFQDLDVNIKPLYLFKAFMFPNLSIKALKQNNYGGICVCRTTEFDQLQGVLDKRKEWKDVLYVAEDNAILDASLDTITSKKVRQSAKNREPLEHLVGGVVSEYFRVHHIGPKVRVLLPEVADPSLPLSSCCQMNGDEKWTEEEKHLPKIMSRNPTPLLGPPDRISSRGRPIRS
jgi:nicotinic acid mononucleotide adenylyltransferase